MINKPYDYKKFDRREARRTFGFVCLMVAFAFWTCIILAVYS